MRLRACPFLLFVVLLLMAQPFIALPSEGQYYSPSISIYALSPSDVDIQTPTTTNRTVTFSTTVHVYDPNNYHLDVNLGLYDGPEWPTEVVPCYMSFNTTGDRSVTITVDVPAGITQGRDVQIRLTATMSYSGTTKQAYSDPGYIYLLQHYALELAWHPIQKDQYKNTFELTVKNLGTGPDNYFFRIQNSYETDREHIEVNFGHDNYVTSLIQPNQTATVEMQAYYTGSSYPKEFVLQVRLNSMGAQDHGMSPSTWDAFVQVSFVAPDRTQQNYMFAGVISAAVIMMVVVMATLAFGSGKRKEGKET